MKTGKIISLAILVLALSSDVRSQDLHFSQYEQIPLLLNPALTGIYKGDVRAFMNYKEQWSSIENGKYETFLGSLDMKVLKEKKKGGFISEGDFLAAGLVLYSDKTAYNALKKTKISLSLSSNKIISSRHSLTAGLQTGYTQKKYDDSQLTWNNQFNGYNFDPNLESGESSEASSTYMDVSAGLLWRYRVAPGMVLNLGVAGFHLNKPQNSISIDNSDDLSRKLIVHAKTWVKLKKNPQISIMPNLLFARQGTQMETSAGSYVRYQLKNKIASSAINNEAILVGVNYRLKDAAVVTVLYEYHEYQLGLSYDINTSELNEVSKGLGGFELSLRYIGADLFGRKTEQIGPML